MSDSEKFVSQSIRLTLGLDNLLEHRKNSSPKPGPTIYAIRALALALSERTASAGRLVGNQIIHPSSIDIGFAVEVDDGVLVPVIRKVDQIPFKDLLAQYSSTNLTLVGF